jgi:hypothetical protein
MLTLILPILAYSHSGGTNQDGCHVNRTTGIYHCHKSKPPPLGGGLGVSPYQNWCIKQDYRTVGCGYSSYNSCASAAAHVDYGYCVRAQ